MIVPFELAVTTANTPQRPFNSTDNLILAGLVAGNPLSNFSLGNLPAYAFGLSGLRVESNTAGVTVNFGLWNSTTKYTLWMTNGTQIQYAQVGFIGSPIDGYLYVPQGNSYVFAAWLSSAPGATVILTGELRVAFANYSASANTIT
jgi:hypothetical protein